MEDVLGDDLHADALGHAAQGLPEELGAALKDFDAVIVRSATKVRAPHIDEAKTGRLKLIIRGGVGVDNIDVKYAEEAGCR